MTTEPTRPQLQGRAKFVAAPLAALWTTVPGILGFFALGFIASLNTWIRGFGDNAWLVYVAMFAVCSGIGFLPTYAMSMIGGWIFGFQHGTLGAIAGFVGGAVVGYVVSMLAGGPALGRWLEHKPAVHVVRDALLGKGFWRSLGIVTLLRLPPSSPFALMNFAMTAARVRIVPYILGTAIGMTPRTAIAAYVAAAAAAAEEPNFQALFAKRTWEFIAGLVITFIILMILGQIASIALRRAGIVLGGAK
ncbi:MAG: VTT domain-containing protein [Phycisphaerae bacterium]|nr:VTT domain-containing protein [Phycisphaerae bacterium]